ncbi:MAG TPA: hypothetical protein VF623_00590, partial [Segetibacter sp.]
FKSTGTTNITKLVEYEPFSVSETGRLIYNLGFGDYDEDNNTYYDDSISNNNDPYIVFGTVLHTVPVFFKKHPKGIIFVRGSDSTEEYSENCRKTCTRNCTEVCRKANRRISTYRGYVDKNYDDLSKQYNFRGGFVQHSQIITEEYKKNIKYDAILVYK